MDRFASQVAVEGLGHEGQARLAACHVVVVGTGALGTVSASFVARAGVARVTLIDPDRVEAPNLHRQILFDDDDATAGRAKAEVVAGRLARVHPGQCIASRVERLDASNALDLLSGADLVLDGTDNYATRYLINEVCVRLRTPWVYGGIIGATGMGMVVVPGSTPCLRCVFGQTPMGEGVQTPSSAGAFGPVVGMVGAWQAGEALRLLAGRWQPHPRPVVLFDLWTGRFERADLGARNAACPVCAQQAVQRAGR